MTGRTTEEQPSSAAALEEPLLPTTEANTNANANANASSSLQQVQVLFDGLPLETSILIKSLYFLDALGSSTWGRFSAIYYNLHGLNSQHIGMIEGIRTAIPTLSQLFWGVVADRYWKSQKRVWLWTKTVSTVILLTLALPLVYNSFWNILIVSIAAQLFVSDGILDAYTLDLLGRANKMFYGRYRLWSSLSWGVGSIIMGWVTDRYHNFEPNFILFGILSFLMVALVAFKIPDADPDGDGENDADDVPVTATTHADTTSSSDATTPATNINAATTESQHQQHQSEETGGHIMELVQLAARPRVALFLLEVVMMGAAMATVERLLFLYMVNDLQASTLLCGLSVGVNVVFELPIFWYASHIMAVLGHDGMYLVAMACFVVRVLGYTYLMPSTKWFILVLEVMHGVTFACFWVVSTDIAKVLVHQTKGAFWKTAIPSTVQMLYSAVGVSVGSVLGGWAMHRYGSRTMYKWTAGIVGVMWVLHLVGSIATRVFWNGTSLLPDYTDNNDDDDDDDDDDDQDDELADDGQETSPLVETPIDNDSGANSPRMAIPTTPITLQNDNGNDLETN